MDDAHGRSEATRRGIRTIGTLGVLRTAAIQDMIDLRPALTRLLSSNFRVPASLVEELIAEDAERRSAK